MKRKGCQILICISIIIALAYVIPTTYSLYSKQQPANYNDIIMGMYLVDTPPTGRHLQSDTPENPGIFFENTLLPYSIQTNQFYLSQDYASPSWSGALSTNRKGYLCTPSDPYWQNKSAAISENHPFTVWLVTENGYYEWELIISGMPVMNIATFHSAEPESIAYEEDPDKYVYDSETGLYYLQSRYYDPEVGRFVNADALVATGQGLLGNNMFAYCHNNPVNYCDPTGMLLYPGEIHNAVVKHIANKYQLTYEQRILYGNGKYGRADLISLDGQVWDVKRDKPRHIEAGKRQVKNYVANTWQNAPEGVTLKVGGDLIESGSFYHQSGQTTYKVTYRNAGNGVIAYDYAPVKRQTQSVTKPSVIAAGAAITAGIVLGLITSRVSVKNN